MQGLERTAATTAVMRSGPRRSKERDPSSRDRREQINDEKIDAVRERWQEEVRWRL